MNESYAPAIREAIQQRDERHLLDILARIPEQDRTHQVNETVRGMPPLLAAATTGQLGLTTALLDAGAAVEGHNLFGMTALHLAAAHGHVPTVEKLIQYDAPVNARNEHGITPLMSAAQNNRADAVEVLLEAGADPSRVDRQGRTAEAMATGEAQQVLVAHRERIVLRAAADVSEEPAPRARRRM